jgi:hypothetical protein
MFQLIIFYLKNNLCYKTITSQYSYLLKIKIFLARVIIEV